MDSLVKIALDSLTMGVNLSTAPSHPSDKAETIDYLRLLIKNGNQVNPDEIRTYLIKCGWTLRGADAVKKIAFDLLSGKKIKGGRGIPDEKRLLAYWENKQS